MSKKSNKTAAEALQIEIDREEAERVAREIDGAIAVPSITERCWLGWVYAVHGRDGYVRRRVRIPHSFIDDLADGAEQGPDLRGTLVAMTANDSSSDEFMVELHAEAQK